MSFAYSPTLSAASSSSHRNMAIQDLAFDEEMDFSQLLNFDEIDSGASSHSPTTISPNRTPSPMRASHSPIALSPDFRYFDPLPDEFGYDILKHDILKQLQVKQDAGPASFPNVQVKQEPLEFGWNAPAPPHLGLSAAALARPLEPFDLSGIPMEQHTALQQLMLNIMSYQNMYGVDKLDTPNTATLPTSNGTVQPSMLFSASPSSAYPSSSSSSSFISPAVLTAPSSAPAVSNSSSPKPTFLHDIPEEEPLRSIEPHENPRKRSAPAFDADDIDDIDSKISELVPIESIFSAGRGKGGKKGGGLSSVVRMEDEDIDEDDSWRPSPEEYKKLSSKEKRQLRNKLSARAFRTRRKDYIVTLEGHIKDRDTVIDAIRADLINTKNEAQDLRRELAALKASTMAVLHPDTANKSSQSPALITALNMSATLPPAPPTPTRRAPTPTFSAKKDVPPSPTLAKARKNANGDYLTGGNTICHTMFSPEVPLPSAPRTLQSFHDLPRVNLNPLLSGDDHRGPSLQAVGNGRDIASSSFSDWSENNAFSLRSMDSYRMQMWSRLAREAQAEKTGLAAELRPKFFSEAKPASPVAEASSPALEANTAAFLAGQATSHITSRLASSFWAAFTGPTAKLDGDKLADVVTGKARLTVVDNEKEPSAPEEDLISALGGLKLQSTLNKADARPAVNARENPIAAISGLFRMGSNTARA